MSGLHLTIDIFGVIGLVATAASCLWVALHWVGWQVGRARARRARRHLAVVPDRTCRPRTAAQISHDTTRRTAP